MKVDKKSGLITGAATVLVGGGVALGLILSGNSSNSPTPAPVKVADVTAAPVSSTASVVSPSNVGVKPAANNVAPIQQPKVEEPVTDPSSEPDPAPSTSAPVQYITVVPDSDGRAGNAPPPPPAPSYPNAVPVPSAPSYNNSPVVPTPSN